MEGFEKARTKSLLEHFSEVEDFRASWRLAHPLPEVLLLVVCATVASCDDFDDIAAWGEEHLPFLRRFLSFHHGVTFKDDLARVRKGFGAKNMAVVRHFAINLVRNAKDKKSIKVRRKPITSSKAGGLIKNRSKRFGLLVPVKEA